MQLMFGADMLTILFYLLKSIVPLGNGSSLVILFLFLNCVTAGKGNAVKSEFIHTIVKNSNKFIKN